MSGKNSGVSERKEGCFRTSPRKIASFGIITVLLVLLVLCAAGCRKASDATSEDMIDLPVQYGESADGASGEASAAVSGESEESESGSDSADVESAPAESSEESVAVSNLTFASKKLLEDHYKKHGIEMGFASAAEYLAAANRVVANPASLHKLEAEDGDDVYYLEATNEFVVVSTKGYIRTYFLPSGGKAYFDRQ